VRSAARIATRVEAIEVFAQSLVAGDVVGLEATSGSDRIVSILQRHGVRVVVANTRRLRSITEAKAKTDRLDARALARLLVSGLLDEVWTPDERSRTLRRLTGRRERVVRTRTRAKNEVHGVLGRNLCDRPPVVHLFSKAGRRWLAALELPLDERLTLDGCLRQIDFLDSEIASLDAVIASQALAWPEVLRLMTVPGVNVQTAATFMASVGDIRRFSSPRQLVSYLGLDPRVRQSGNAAARHGRISKAGASEPRHMLGEVAWKVARTPGPLRAFFERVRARRGPQIAATATARKLVVLFWHLLTREQDYAFGRPAMTRNKIRRLELLAGAPPQKGRHGIAGGKSKAVFDAERELSRQAEAAYRRLVSDWRSAGPAKVGAGAVAEVQGGRQAVPQAPRRGGRSRREHGGEGMSVAARLPRVRRRGRRAVLAAVAVAAIAVVAWLLLGSGDGSGTKASNDTVPLGSAAVERRDLVAREDVDGTLGFSDATAAAAPAAGTITRLRDEGDTVALGRSLMSIDAEATAWVLYGTIPIYRDLGPGVADGREVRQLERNLEALGYDTGITTGEPLALTPPDRGARPAQRSQG
jgi:transposase